MPTAEQAEFVVRVRVLPRLPGRLRYTILPTVLRAFTVTVSGVLILCLTCNF